MGKIFLGPSKQPAAVPFFFPFATFSQQTSSPPINDRLFWSALIFFFILLLRDNHFAPFTRCRLSLIQSKRRALLPHLQAEPWQQVPRQPTTDLHTTTCLDTVAVAAVDTEVVVTVAAAAAVAAMVAVIAATAAVTATDTVVVAMVEGKLFQPCARWR